jgi:ribulose-phosphate 3-epimerase
MPEVLPKVRHARQEIDARRLQLPIQVDGGIDAATVPAAAEAGATVFVAGSAIFGAEDPLAAARAIRVAAERVHG